MILYNRTRFCSLFLSFIIILLGSLHPIIAVEGKIVNLTNHNPLEVAWEFRDFSRISYGVSWNKISNIVAFATSEKVYLLDGNDGSLINIVDVNFARTLKWSPKHDLLAIVPYMSFCNPYSIPNITITLIDSDGNIAMRIEEPSGGCPDLVSVDWNPNGTYIVVGSKTGFVTVYSLEGDIIWRTYIQGRNIESIAWSPKGDKIAVGGSFGLVILDEEGREIMETGKLEGSVMSISWSPDGTKIIIGLSRGIVRMMDSSDLSVLWEWTITDANPSDNFFRVSVSWDSYADKIGISFLWDEGRLHSDIIMATSDGEILWRLGKSEKVITALDWNREGSGLVYTGLTLTTLKIRGGWLEISPGQDNLYTLVWNNETVSNDKETTYFLEPRQYSLYFTPKTILSPSIGNATRYYEEATNRTITISPGQISTVINNASPQTILGKMRITTNNQTYMIRWSEGIEESSTSQIYWTPPGDYIVSFYPGVDLEPSIGDPVTYYLNATTNQVHVEPGKEVEIEPPPPPSKILSLLSINLPSGTSYMIKWSGGEYKDSSGGIYWIPPGIYTIYYTVETIGEDIIGNFIDYYKKHTHQTFTLEPGESKTLYPPEIDNLLVPLTINAPEDMEYTIIWDSGNTTGKGTNTFKATPGEYTIIYSSTSVLKKGGSLKISINQDGPKEIELKEHYGTGLYLLGIIIIGGLLSIYLKRTKIVSNLDLKIRN